MNKIMNVKEVLSKIKDGSTILVGGFMTCGTPEVLIDAIVEKGVKDLTIVCSDAGYENDGVGKLIKNDQVKTLIASHIGLNPLAGQKMNDGSMEVELVPQGTLAERIRAHGAGLGGVLTPTGVGTTVQDGKKVIEVKGAEYLLELPIKGDVAILSANVADELGNLTYSKTARNFNPIMATAAEYVIACPKEIVKLGEIDPEVIITPHVFVNSIVEVD